MTTSIKRIRRLSAVVVGASFLLAGVASAAPADPDPVAPASRLPDGSGPLIRGWRFTEYVTDLQAAEEVDSGSEVGPAFFDEEVDFGPQTVVAVTTGRWGWSSPGGAAMVRGRGGGA